MAKHQILIIDHSSIIRAQIREILSPDHFEILEAEDGIEGLRLIRQSPPHLIFLDFLVPPLNSREILQQLKTDFALRNIPVVVMCEYPEVVTAKIPEPSKDFELLEKPFSHRQLIATLKIALPEYNPSRSLIPQGAITYRVKSETPNSEQPRNCDVVLGYQIPTPTNGIVLGGLEGVRQRFASPLEVQRVAALKEALNYGQSGLNLVIKALTDSSAVVKQTADLLLRQRADAKAQLALPEFSSYQFFECLRTLIGHSCYILSLAISPDGSTLVSASCDGTIQLWNLRTSEKLHTFQDNSHWVTCITISPDGETLVSGSQDGTIKLWNLQTGREKNALITDSSVMCIAITPDSQTLVSGHSNGSIKLWNLPTGTQKSVLEGHSKEVYAAAISPDGKTLVSGSNDGTIKLWNLPTGTEKNTLIVNSSVLCIAVSPDGQTLVSGSRDGIIKVWDLYTGVEKMTLHGHSSSVNSLAISSDSQILVSGSGDQTIKLWNLQLGVELRTLIGYSFVVHCVAMSPNGQTLVSGHSNGKIKVWGAV